MKYLPFLFVTLSLLFISCESDFPDISAGELNCQEYWAEVSFSSFCGLSTNEFDFNTQPTDICNADFNDNYPFDDRVFIRVYNHFSEEGALEEHNREDELANGMDEYTSLTNVGDKAFAVIKTSLGRLDLGWMEVVKGQYTVYLEINADASNGANNCFDVNLMTEFARELVRPL